MAKKLRYTPNGKDFEFLLALKDRLDRRATYDAGISYRDMECIAEDEGATMLGSGCFSYCITHPTDDRLCVKIGLGEHHAFKNHWQDPWMGWAAYCIRHVANEYIPGVYVLQVYPGFYLALMERLEKSDGHGKSDDMAFALRSMDAGDIEGGCTRVSTMRLWQRLGRVCHKLAPAARLDVHSGNIMLRGITPVLTDPLAWDYSKKEALAALRKVQRACNNVTVRVRRGARV